MKAENYSPILEDAGIRPTSTRLLIYGAICRMSDTFSLTSLEDELQSIDKSVIFRTLTLFHDHHLIHSVDDGSGSHTTGTASLKRSIATSIARNARKPIA